MRQWTSERVNVERSNFKASKKSRAKITMKWNESQWHTTSSFSLSLSRKFCMVQYIKCQLIIITILLYTTAAYHKWNEIVCPVQCVQIVFGMNFYLLKMNDAVQRCDKIYIENTHIFGIHFLCISVWCGLNVFILYV